MGVNAEVFQHICEFFEKNNVKVPGDVMSITDKEAKTFMLELGVMLGIFYWVYDEDGDNIVGIRAAEQ